MILRIFILLFSATLLAQAGKWQTSPSGLKYKVIKDVKGTNAAFGNYVSINFQFLNYKDSLINSNAGKEPLEILLQKTFKGSLEEGMTMMSVGDSMIFQIQSDSLGFPTTRPPFLPMGSMVYFRVKMLNVYTEEQFKAVQEKKIAEQKKAEDVQLQDYIKKNNLVATKLPSGMYIVIQSPGAGAQAEAGQNVEVHYTGKLLNGQVFDSSVGRGSPFSFALGQGRVIQGWDVGIAELKVGTKAVLLIPSYMGYGPQGAPPSIPANAILIFEVELLGIK
jgi:FKBP-type peptidyl-prolyl cis-trans isomerase FkpA